MRLSHRRARAVRDYLISQGIDPDRLDAIGYGDEKPIATNKTKAGRAENRRIEVHIRESAWDRGATPAVVPPAGDER